MNSRTESSPPTVLLDATLATMDGDAPYGLVERGAIAIEAGSISWVGAERDLPGRFAAHERRALDGRLVTPALVDCHTHVVHGGDRAGEFEMRLEGASYEALARAGGGIVSTVAATRAADVDALVESALPRVDALIGEGVATLEIKSGYGLDRDAEIAMLRAARRLGELRPVRVRTSFLGAHAVPEEYAGRADAYLDEVCLPTLDAAHAEGLVDAVDGFCEGIAFSPEQIGRVFDRASALGLPVKLHAEQLSRLGGGDPRGRARARCRPIIWSTRPRTTRARWPPPAPSRCCCPGRSTRCARASCRPSRRSAPPACRWRSPRTATPAPRR